MTDDNIKQFKTKKEIKGEEIAAEGQNHLDSTKADIIKLLNNPKCKSIVVLSFTEDGSPIRPVGCIIGGYLYPLRVVGALEELKLKLLTHHLKTTQEETDD